MRATNLPRDTANKCQNLAGYIFHHCAVLMRARTMTFIESQNCRVLGNITSNFNNGEEETKRCQGTFPVTILLVAELEPKPCYFWIPTYCSSHTHAFLNSLSVRHRDLLNCGSYSDVSLSCVSSFISPIDLHFVTEGTLLQVDIF